MSNVEKWVRFYRNMAKGNVPLHKYGHAERGAPLGRASRGPTVIPLEPYCKQQPGETALEKPSIRVVSPAEQVVQQAKSEIKARDTIKRSGKPANVSKPPKRRRVKKLPRIFDIQHE